ncbi:MAG: hypothetical protein WC961_07195 [Anaerovoracaceae bacterium]|jgi:hypothetical protein
MKTVIVIHELDHDDHEKCVIGVAESVEQAEAMIKEYYGDYKEVAHWDIREHNFHYVKTLEVMDHKNIPYRVTITLEWFALNKV